MIQKTTLQILLRARELVARGWCQNQHVVYSMGAVIQRDLTRALHDAAAGMGMEAMGTPAHRRAYQMVRAATGAEGIRAYNDDPHMTQGAVLFMLDCCIYVEQRHEFPHRPDPAGLEALLASEPQPLIIEHQVA